MSVAGTLFENRSRELVIEAETRLVEAKNNAEIIHLQGVIEELLRALHDCVPMVNDSLGISDTSTGFRGGWNAARSFTSERVQRALTKHQGPSD